MLINESGEFTPEFSQALPEMLGDNYYNDPDTKQKPTKIFENVKDVKTLLNNYANAQRTISKGEAAFAEKTAGMVKVPTDKSTPEEVAAFRKALGVPDKPEAYELAIPDVTDADKAVYGSIADTVKKTALKTGVPPQMVAPVWNEVVNALAASNKQMEEAGAALMKADEEALKVEWGPKYNENNATVDKVLGKLQTGPKFKEIMDTFGLTNHPSIKKALLEMAPLILEGKTITGDTTNPAQAPSIKDQLPSTAKALGW